MTDPGPACVVPRCRRVGRITVLNRPLLGRRQCASAFRGTRFILMTACWPQQAWLGVQHHPGSESLAIVGNLRWRVSDPRCGSASVLRQRFARRRPGRRLCLQAQVREDLLDHLPPGRGPCGTTHRPHLGIGRQHAMSCAAGVHSLRAAKLRGHQTDQVQPRAGDQHCQPLHELQRAQPCRPHRAKGPVPRQARPVLLCCTERAPLASAGRVM